MVLKVQKVKIFLSKILSKLFPIYSEGGEKLLKKRKRNIQVKFYVDEEELNLINERFKAANVSNRGAYLRKMAIDGFVVNIDTSDIKQLVKEVNAIGRNVNQAVALMNRNGAIGYSDSMMVKAQVDNIWQLLKSTLSNIQSVKQ